MFIPAIISASGYMIALGAIQVDKSKWMRWYKTDIINSNDYPRVIAYKTREEARTHARNVLRRGKQLEVFPDNAKSIVIKVQAT